MTVLISIISVLFSLYQFLILIRVLLSWVNVSPYSPWVQALYRVTEPVLQPLRRLIPPIGGTLDISPVVAMIVLEIARRILFSLLAA